MESYQEKIRKKFEWLSLKYHNLSLLFNELGKSLEIQMKNKSLKECKKILKDCNFDFEKIAKISKGVADISLKDLKKEKKCD
jgi:hypothetical protein